jgi:hypothetical protein
MEDANIEAASVADADADGLVAWRDVHLEVDANVDDGWKACVVARLAIARRKIRVDAIILMDVVVVECYLLLDSISSIENDVDCRLY